MLGRKLDHWAYVCTFAALAICGTIAASVGQVTVDNRSCRSNGYGNDDFLAYCNSTNYGDYEHGALYYGLEPGVVENMRAAQVLFLGNSRTQAAFSTEAMRSYFRQQGLRFFVLGFGYDEFSPFALALIRKWHLRPRVVVVNADPFFSDRLQPPARDALDGKPAYLWRLLLKMLFQRVHPVVCATVRCGENQGSIFRSRRDGEWAWIPYFVEERAMPLNPSQTPVSGESVQGLAAMAAEFFAAIGMAHDCVVFTGTPSSEQLNSAGVAIQLAKTLHAKSITPPSDGLTTIDVGHLNRASAERWSAQFAQELTPVLRECIGR